MPRFASATKPAHDEALETPLRIVVPCSKVDSKLRNCLSEIKASLKERAFELIVVGDGVPNSNLRELASEFQVKIRNNPRPGSAARTRNWGARDFRSGILCFIDADVIVERGAIRELIRPILRLQAKGSVGNYSKKVERLGFFARYKQLYISQVYGRQAGEIQNEFWSALCAIDAKTFHKVGGFNESYEGAGGEDTEFGLRLSESGAKLWSVPKATGVHMREYSLTSLIVNDLKKGSKSIEHILCSKAGLKDNRHSSSRDMLAVILSSSFLLNLLLSSAGFRSSLNLLLGVILLLAYSFCRADILKACKSQGLTFLIKSFLLCYLLDLVRATAVSLGIWRVLFKAEEFSPEPVKSSAQRPS